MFQLPSQSSIACAKGKEKTRPPGKKCQIAPKSRPQYFVGRKSLERWRWGEELLPDDLWVQPSRATSVRFSWLFCVAFVFGLLVELFPFTLAHAFFKAQTANCFSPPTPVPAACHAPLYMPWSRPQLP